MPRVVIDGVEYVPRAEISELTDKSLEAALKGLVSIQYFSESHKAVPQAWNVLNELAPELAKLAADDPRAAYERMHGTDEDN